MGQNIKNGINWGKIDQKKAKMGKKQTLNWLKFVKQKKNSQILAKNVQ